MVGFNSNFDPSIIDDDTEGAAFTAENKKDSEKVNATDENTQKKRTIKNTVKVTEDDEDSDDKEETLGFWSSFASFFTDKRTHRVVGVLLFVISAYILICCISFISGAGDKDMSKVSTSPITVIAQNQENLNEAYNAQSIENSSNAGKTSLAEAKKEVENKGGATGAYIGQILINNSLGLSAFIVIAYCFIISIAIIINKKIPFWEITFKTLLFVITLSISAATFTYYEESTILYGGMHGRMVVTTLTNYGGYMAALCLSIFLIAVVVILYIKQIVTVFQFTASSISKLFPKKQKDLTDDEDSELTDDITPENQDASEEETSAENQEDVKDEEIQENEAESLKINIDENPESDINDDDTADMQERVTSSEEMPDGPSLEIKTTTIETAEHLGPETPYDPTAELSQYQFPPVEILKEYDTAKVQVDIEEQEENKQRITQALGQYGISIQKIEATVGPTITLYEIVPAEGVRIQQIKNLENDLMLNLAATGIRIIAPMPGRGTIGIEVPNKDPQIVSIRSILSSKKYRDFKGELPMAVGATISNEVYIADLAKMPHLLVAGATGQGKSVGMNTIIASLLYKKHPATLKFVLIDPKYVEFSLYSKLERHYLAKLPEEEDSIITTPDRAVATLNSLCIEMDNRYALLRDASCRTIKEYNEKFISRKLNPEKGHRYLPYIVVIVDEFADIIATAGKEIELPISRITAKARAVGIHMILSTQRPSTNVITGTIKANVPSRIAFKVSQMIDSRTIIDAAGAQHLIGRGDMLFLNAGKTERVQCALIETSEVEAICDFIDKQVGYDHAYFLPDYNPNESNSGNAGAVTDRDELFEDAARFIVSTGIASTSSLQRHFRIGYNRAGSLVDQFAAAGIIGPQQGMKPRQVLMDSTSLEMFLETLK